MEIKFEIKDILKRLHTIENSLFKMSSLIHKSKRKKPMEQNQQQTDVIRAALIEKCFSYYHQLAGFLNHLPIDKSNPALMQDMAWAQKNIANGMLWVKEVLSTSPIKLDPLDAKKPEAALEPATEVEPAPDAA